MAATHLVRETASLARGRPCLEPDMSENRYFLILCREDRQYLYRAVLKSCEYDSSFALTPEDVLRQCLRCPPWAIVMDIPTQISLDSRLVSVICDLKVKWPVLRCNIFENGAANVLCLRPNRSDDLLSAMKGITENDESWVGPGPARQYLRVEHCCRVRLTCDGGAWRNGNTLDLSSSGASIVSYDKLSVNTKLRIEIRDLADEPVYFNATIRWSRCWEKSRELPAIGVSFDAPVDAERVIDVITDGLLNSLN